MIKIYRKGEGKVVRTCAYIAFLALGFLLCQMVYNIPSLGSPINRSLYATEFFGMFINITTWFLVTVVIFAVVAFVGFQILNIGKISDFLIETESELKKVSWPKRNEYISASIAIFFMLVFTVIYLLVIDQGLTMVMGYASDMLGVTIGF